jgi:sec-independent protein translocase protein TatC
MAVIPKLRRRPKDPTGTMTLIEHLAELRNRLIVAIFAIGLGAVVGWFLYGPVFDVFIRNPYCNLLHVHPELGPQGVGTGACRFVYFSPVEPFFIKIKIATFIGLIVALPVVLFQVWRFVTPGLTSKERRYTIPFIASSLVLFGLGAWFGYITLPKALDFLLGFAGTNNLVGLLQISKYITFVMFMVLAFGLSFEFPLLLISLVLVGVLTSARLRAWRRQAIVGIAVFAAVATPTQDWFTMTAMMVPLIIFYELAILVARFVLKK